MDDPNVGLVVETDNGLRPEDGDQLIAGYDIESYTDEELAAMEGIFGGDDE